MHRRIQILEPKRTRSRIGQDRVSNIVRLLWSEKFLAPLAGDRRDDFSDGEFGNDQILPAFTKSSRTSLSGSGKYNFASALESM